MIDLRITIKGKVQGVWFRVKTKEQADKLTLNGFVQNKDDGSVYVEISGNKEDAYKLIQWLQAGPDLSIVDSVCIKINTISHSNKFTINP